MLAGLLLIVAPAGGRAEEWFDAYDRALQALKQKKGARAVELLERAIRMRPEPGTNIITYGTNRLPTYHPYVRLAEAHLLLGDAEAAAEALRRSEAQGKEPAAERARLAAEVQALQRAKVAAATPPPTAPPAPAVVAPAPAVATPAPVAVPAPVATPPAAAASPVAAPPPVPTAAPGASVGTLELRTDPPGATALLGGRLLGVTPLRVELAPGTYQVILRKEGAADQAFPVRVAAGGTTSEARALVLTATPAPAPASTPAGVEAASLVVYSDPPGAAVYLDDEPIGETDPGSGRLVKSAVAPGPHRLRLSRPGYADLVQELQVGASGPSTIRATLTGVPRGSGWVLAALVGIGALVLSAGGWLLFRRQAPAEGTVALPGGTPATTATRVRQRAATPASRSTKVSPPTVDAEGGGLEGLLETRALPAAPAGVGERFGEYLLLEPLGKGGMATVFKAERNGEHVALKRPLPAFLDDPEFLERFLREAEIGRTLHHPNIIRIFERGEVSGVPYFTMELVRGRTLQARLRELGALAPKAATQVIVQVAEALDYAHLKGVVHRDLKPSNIMLLEDGAVKVMDYGIARARRFSGLTVTGAFLGTPDYVAPETAEGRATDARSDLYSLGVVFYEVLTGRKPFVADTPFGVLSKHVNEPPPPPSAVAPGCPRELEAVVLRLLAKDPDERHPGAEELLIELREFLNRAA
jgi:predicted Ser/Thr protein kinase